MKHRSRRKVDEVEVGDTCSKPLEHYANQSFPPTFIPIMHPSLYACILCSTVSLGTVVLCPIFKVKTDPSATRTCT